jgi:two-component sensor histidine kinase
VQGLLFRKNDGGRVTFDELIETELSAQSILVGVGGPVTLDGPKDIPLLSGTVQTFAMVLHELVTNAVKYGALKQPNGHLTIRWRQEASAESGKPCLHLDWKESGVEMPPFPQHTGQGRELIEKALPYQFDAQTTLPWNRMAFIAPFRFPSPKTICERSVCDRHAAPKAGLPRATLGAACVQPRLYLVDARWLRPLRACEVAPQDRESRR